MSYFTVKSRINLGVNRASPPNRMLCSRFAVLSGTPICRHGDTHGPGSLRDRPNRWQSALLRPGIGREVCAGRSSQDVATGRDVSVHLRDERVDPVEPQGRA